MSYVWDGFNIQNSTHFFYYLCGTMYIIPLFYTKTEKLRLPTYLVCIFQRSHFISNLVSGLIAYSFFLKKPAIKYDPIKTTQLAIF